MFLGLVISVIPRKSPIFGVKSVGVAGLQPNTIYMLTARYRMNPICPILRVTMLKTPTMYKRVPI